MRNFFCFLFGAVLLTACEPHSPTAAEKTQPRAAPRPLPAPPAAATSPAQALLALYRTYPLPLRLSAKRLADADAERDTVNTGVAIPPALRGALGAGVLETDERAEVFSIAQVPLSATTIGLLTRVDESTMQLFVFDPRQQRILATYPLVERDIETDAVFVREATLCRGPGRSLLIAVRQRTGGVIEEDPTVERTGATSMACRDSLLLYRLRNNRLQVLSRTETGVTYGHLGAMGDD